MAKRSAQETHDLIQRYHENVILQRNELIHKMGRPDVTREDCRPVFEKLAALRVQSNSSQLWQKLNLAENV